MLIGWPILRRHGSPVLLADPSDRENDLLFWVGLCGLVYVGRPVTVGIDVRVSSFPP